MKFVLFFLILNSVFICHSQTKYRIKWDADKKYSKGDYKGAIIVYNSAIEKDSLYTNAYNFRGFSKFFIKDYKGAIIDFTKSIELNPKKHDIYYFRGLSYYYSLNIKDAIEDF